MKDTIKNKNIFFSIKVLLAVVFVVTLISIAAIFLNENTSLEPSEVVTEIIHSKEQFMKGVLNEELQSEEGISDKYIEEVKTDRERDHLDRGYKTSMTSFFWVGEEADAENDYISNSDSAWDSYWVERYGGVDSVYDRCGYRPCSFVPKENPFYFALPYNDLDFNDKKKEQATQIPWYEENKNKKSILKNRWIEINYGGKKCFAQWEDVGPNGEEDYDFVFGNAEPINKFGVKAGLDVSPAVRDCLEMKDNDYTSWRFVDDEQVEKGPWKETVTTGDVSR